MFPEISNGWQLTLLCCCVVSYTNASTSFIIVLIYYFPPFVPKFADVAILYSHKVLKIFDHHLNHKYKFTITTGNTIYVIQLANNKFGILECKATWQSFSLADWVILSVDCLTNTHNT